MTHICDAQIARGQDGVFQRRRICYPLLLQVRLSSVPMANHTTHGYRSSASVPFERCIILTTAQQTVLLSLLLALLSVRYYLILFDAAAQPQLLLLTLASSGHVLHLRLFTCS